VQAFEHSHPMRNEKYLSPILSMLKNPHPVTTPDSHRPSMVAPTVRAMGLLSDLPMRQRACDVGICEGLLS
jgi:hypothetical protein